MHSSPADIKESPNKIWFVATILFLIVDLARPQAVLPIDFLRPGMIVTLVLAICYLLKKHDQTIENPQAKLIIYFVLLLSVYTPFAVNNYFAFLTAKSMWLQLPFIFSCMILINTRERLMTLLMWLVGIMIYISIYSLFHSGRGPGGAVADENDLTLFIVTILPFSFILISANKSILNRLLLSTGIVISLLAIVTASSRGGFVGLVAACCVGWFYSSKKILLLLGIMLMSSLIYIYGGDSFRQEMSTISDTKETTANIRILSWQAGWNMFLDNPLGVGGGNFPVRFSEYQPEYFQRGMWGRVAHSLWFTLLPELGIFGTWIYLSIIFYNVKDVAFMKKIQQPEDTLYPDFFDNLSTAFYASFAGFFASATFLSVLYYPHFWYLTALVAASKNIAAQKINTIE